MKLSDPILHEIFTAWPAWQTLVEHLTTGVDARLVAPADVSAALDELDEERTDRLAHLMIGFAHADDMDEARELVTELAIYAAAGKRPRYGAETGLTFDRFEEMRGDA